MPRNSDAPDWVKWAIEQARPEILATVGAKLLPASWQVLGCGVFGCTMDTSDPRWVCKVTLDGTEAFLAGVLKQIGDRPGVCQYLEPIRLESEAGPLWILWRSRVQMPTLDQFREPFEGMPDYVEMKFARFDEWKSSGKQGADPWKEVEAMQVADEKARGIDALDILRELTQCGLSVAGYLKVRSIEGATIAEFIDELAQGVREYAGDFLPRESMHAWHYSAQSEQGGLHTAAIRMLGYRFQLARLQGNVLVRELAQTLDELTASGVVLCDLNTDNIARLDGVWTLFDGGFCVPTSPSWIPLWQQVRPNLFHWWSNKGWDPVAGLKPGSE